MSGRNLRYVHARWILSALLAVAAVFPVLSAAEADPLSEPAQYLPESTVLYVQVAPWKDWARDWDQTSLAKIAQDPDMRAFLAGPFGKLEELLRSAFAQDAGAPKDAPAGNQPSTIASFFESLSAIAPGPAVVALAYSQEDVDAKRPPGVILVLGTKDPTRFAALAEAFCNLFVKEHVKQQQYGSASMFAVKYESIDFGLILMKDHIVISTRSEFAKQVIDGIAGTAPKKLADNPGYQACRLNQVAHNSVYIDMAALSKLCGSKDRKAGQENVLDTVGLGSIQTIGWSMRMNGPAFETSAAVVSGQQRSGWLSFLDNVSVEPEALKIVRPGSPYAVGMRVRQDKILAVVEELLKRTISSDEFARFQAVKEKVGADKLNADMAQALGTELVITSCSGPGGSPAGALSTDLCSLKVRDAAKAEALLADVMKKVAAERGAGPAPEEALRKLEYDGAKLMYLLPAPGASGLTPVFGISGDRLLMAMDMQTLKFAVRNQKQPGLESDEAFKAALAGTGNDLGSLFVYLDYGQLYAKSYDLFATGLKVLGSVTPIQKAGVDVNLLPAPDSVGRYLFPAMVVIKTTEKGVSIKSRGPLPSPEVIVPPIAAAAAVVTNFAEQMRANSPAEKAKE